MSARYAVYFAPKQGSLLDELGSRWLGRNAWIGHTAEQPPVDGVIEFTAAPRRYGFHATLKAPFHLSGDKAAFLRAVAELACHRPPVTIERIALAEIGGFLALVPEQASEDLHSLAAACVKELDRYRAPLTSAEFERRVRSGLTSRQERLTRNWGYPFVLDEFRFHMTLTRRLEAGEKERVAEAARRLFAAVIAKPLIIDALTVFCEPGEGLDFVAENRFPLVGAVETAWPEAWSLGVR
jgi:putative phosphonate metabolism protein